MGPKSNSSRWAGVGAALSSWGARCPRSAGGAGQLAVLLATAVMLACTSPKPPAASAAEANSKPPAPLPPAALELGPLYVEEQAPGFGDREAPVTIVAFIGFDCGYCASVLPVLVSLQQEFGSDQLRLVYRHAPLSMASHGRAAARAAAVVGQTLPGDAFIRYALWLQSQQEPSDERLRRAALEYGVEAARFDALWADPALEAEIEADLERRRQLGIEAVPAVFVNGRMLLGARPEFEFRAFIEEERREALELRQRGLSAPEVYARRVQLNRAKAPPEGAGPAFVVPIGDSPTLGPSSAPVTVVAFVDFECGFCARAHATMEQVMERYPGRIRWVIKNRVLPMHELAAPAAIVLWEVYRQQGAERYWQAMREVFEPASLTPEVLFELAARYELDPGALNAALALGPQHPRLRADQELGDDLHVRGTPRFFINGRSLEGAQPLPEFLARIDTEIKRAQLQLGEQAEPDADVYALLQAQAESAPGLPRVVPPAVHEDSPTLGSAQAPVTLQVFANLNCGYCARVMPVLRRLAQRHPGEVRLVWRHLPFPNDTHARSAAQAAMEARAQQGDAGFWAMVSALLEAEAAASPEAGPPLASSQVREQAKKLGLNLERFDAALADGRHLEAIERDVDLARQRGVGGTPTVFVNDRVIVGAQPERLFERTIELARREAREQR